VSRKTLGHPSLQENADEISELRAWLEASAAAVVFEMGDQAESAMAALQDCFKPLTRVAMIWDVTDSQGVNQVRERSAASSAVSRRTVSASLSTSKWIPSKDEVLKLQNANGHPLYFYPGLLLVDGGGLHGPALIDYRDISVDVGIQRFLEEESIPRDSVQVDTTWAKVNKNGKPDRRFKNNYQIPIMAYGDVHLTSGTGLNERYMFSSPVVAMAFGLQLIAVKLSMSDPVEFDSLMKAVGRIAAKDEGLPALARLARRYR